MPSRVAPKAVPLVALVVVVPLAINWLLPDTAATGISTVIRLLVPDVSPFAVTCKV